METRSGGARRGLERAALGRDPAVPAVGSAGAPGALIGSMAVDEPSRGRGRGALRQSRRRAPVPVHVVSPPPRRSRLGAERAREASRRRIGCALVRARSRRVAPGGHGLRAPLSGVRLFRPVGAAPPDERLRVSSMARRLRASLPRDAVRPLGADGDALRGPRHRGRPSRDAGVRGSRRRRVPPPGAAPNAPRVARSRLPLAIAPPAGLRRGRVPARRRPARALRAHPVVQSRRGPALELAGGRDPLVLDRRAVPAGVPGQSAGR